MITSRALAASARCRRGFTLMETLLSVSLVLVLAVVAVYGVSGWRRTAALNEGADRFASMLRSLRNEAPIRGRQLRLAFVGDETDPDAPTIKPEGQWQSDPTGAAGNFVRYGGGMWETYLPDGLVVVASCKLTGPSAYRTLSTETLGADRDTTHQPVTFYPDCSSDFATVILRSVHPADTRIAQVSLNGMTGEVTRKQMTEEEAEESAIDN